MTNPDASGSPFRWRGVVEGYYGDALSHADRRWLLERMAEWGLNVYLHAPKDDRFGREAWREPYPEPAMLHFASLVEHGAARGVSVGFGLSPGLSIRYADGRDVECLQRKLAAFAALGARFFALALDDVPSALVHETDREVFGSLGEAHAALACRVREALPDDATLWLVPTDYVGVASSAYLSSLAPGLPAEVEVGWTGRTVLSPAIARDEASVRAGQLGRKLLLWDNTPVNDGPMRTLLHLAPYSGRDPALPESLSGILLNPMERIRASQVTLRCAADYLRDPLHYDAEASWQAAVEQAGAGAPEAFACFARAHRFSPQAPADRDAPLEQEFTALRRAFAGSGSDERAAAVAAISSLVAERVAAADRIRSDLRDRALLAEIEPWLASHAAESRLLEAAVDLLGALARGDRGMPLLQALSRLQGRVGRLPATRVVSYGPRRAFYPQLVDLGDDTARFGPDPVLVRDACLAEEILRFAEAAALEELER